MDEKNFPFVTSSDRKLLALIARQVAARGHKVADWSAAAPTSGKGLRLDYDGAVASAQPSVICFTPVRIIGAANTLNLRTPDVLIPPDPTFALEVLYTPMGFNYMPSIANLAEIVQAHFHLRRFEPLSLDPYIPYLSKHWRGVYVVFPPDKLRAKMDLGRRAKLENYKDGPLLDLKKSNVFIGIPTEPKALWKLWEQGYFVLSGVTSDRLPQQAVLDDYMSSGATFGPVKIPSREFYNIVNAAGKVKAKETVAEELTQGVVFPALCIIGNKGSGKTPIATALKMMGVEVHDSDSYVDAEQKALFRKNFMEAIGKSQAMHPALDPRVTPTLSLLYTEYCKNVADAVAKVQTGGKTKQAFMFHTRNELSSCSSLMVMTEFYLDIDRDTALANVGRRGRDVEFELPLAQFLWANAGITGNCARLLPMEAIGALLRASITPQLGYKEDSGSAKPAAVPAGGAGRKP